MSDFENHKAFYKEFFETFTQNTVYCNETVRSWKEGSAFGFKMDKMTALFHKSGWIFCKRLELIGEALG